MRFRDRYGDKYKREHGIVSQDGSKIVFWFNGNSYLSELVEEEEVSKLVIVDYALHFNPEYTDDDLYDFVMASEVQEAFSEGLDTDYGRSGFSSGILNAS